MKNIFLLCIAFISFCACNKAKNETPVPQETVIFSETFDDNKKGWYTIHNDTANIQVTGGKYKFELTGKNSLNGWYAWYNINLDTTKNFKIEADFEHLTKGDYSPYGLLYGIEGLNNNHFYGLESEGYYHVGKTKDGTYLSNGGWKPVTLKKVNTLTVQKTGRHYYYRLNGVQVRDLNPQYFYGKGIGFYVAGNVSVAIDNLKVTVY